MECCAKLENLLEEQELNSIPQSAKVKLIEQFLSYENLIGKLREENSESVAVLEREQFRFEKEISASKEQLHDSTESCIKLKLQITELEESLSSVQKQWRDLQKIHDSSMLDFQSTKRENELLQQEKRILSEQLDKRRSEIEKLNDDLKSLLDQVTAANEGKFESIALAEEAKLKESNLQHQVNRLEQEKDLLNRQIVDMNAELTQKNSEIHTLKREKSSNIFEMKNMLEERSDQLHTAQKKLDSYKELLEEKDARIEALAEKIRQLNLSQCKSEEQFNLELTAQSKLIDLHKNASEDNQKRVQELMRAFEEARKLLNESNESCTQMEKHCQELELKCKTQLEEKLVEIMKLKEDLKRAKDTAQGISQEKIEQLFPVAAATSKVLHSGMTLTDLYVQYTALQEELAQEKNENANRTRELNNILTEIQEKTPFIQQKMLEFDKLNETISYLKSQQSVALSNNEKLLQERNDAKRLSNLANRENMRLKSQVVDLNRQVQVLLKEVEEARGGFVKDRRDSVFDDDEVSSSDDITAAKVISRHLVTFRDIEELQMKNQQLLAALRDLSQQHEEMEKKVSTELTTKFEKEIANLSTELEDLQKKRVKQSEMLETIIRQRDMYRVLLTSQGFSESLLGQSEGSFSQHSVSPYSSNDSKETKSAMTQLQIEFDNYKKEKAENERMLNEQIDKARSELSELRIKNAKLASQGEYSEERLKMLQSNMDTYKKEYTNSKDKNRQHSSMIIQHQQTINSLRQDLMIAHEKIAKHEVSVENLKAERDLLKSIEARLLQEKESAVKEKQHQSRMMANLQSVQNNLERIESESKRNMQHQIEKYEKEVAIFKTKLENASEEYRSAVNVWEKQKKEYQSKIDAEVSRNRKVHEDLVDAYSQMHALKQEVTSLKTQSALTSEKSSSSDPQSKTPTKITNTVPSLAEVRILKEQLNEANSKLKALQDKLSITSKSAEQYLNMCKDLELRVKEQDEINKQLKDSMDHALNSSSETRTTLEKKLENMEKNNRELIEENMKLTQDSDSQITDLQKKMNDSSKVIENYKNEAESAKKIAEQAREDCQNEVKLMQEVQDKYQRELMLHAEDVKKLTEIKEEHQKCSTMIEKLNGVAKAAEHALNEGKESWSRQEQMLQSEIQALKTKLSDLESCNNNLHNQLEMIGTQMAALQSKNWEETSHGSIQSNLKDTQQLLQVIQFVKKEKEIAETKYDMAQSESIRLNIKVEQLTNEINSTKSELKDLMNNAQAKASSEAQHAELLKKIEMMNLLTESNNLLRMEKESLSEAKSKLENELHELQEKFQPLSEREKELSQNIEMLSAENDALRIEVKSWQSRTNQLLEQSHRIGPQEYKNVMREMEELKTQKARLAEELQRKQAEVSQVVANMGSLRKDLESSRKEMKDKEAEKQKMADEMSEHHKTVLQLKKIARKYKQQFDEVKSAYDVLEEKSKVLDSVNQEQNVQEMQKKVTDSEKEMEGLKEEIKKQKLLLEQTKKEAERAQLTAKEKEEKAKKLLAQFRQKYSQLNREKEVLSEEKLRLGKDVEGCKTQISHLTMSQEENAQMKNHSSAKIARLEKELKAANDLRISERKEYDELLRKVAQQKQGLKSPIVGIGDRTSGGTELLTANIKPITSPSTSGTSSGLRHSPHPVSSTNRPTPTASIRPMAIGTASSATPTQTRMAAVLPTTATPQQSTEEVVASSPSVAVPHAAVQPTPATATVAPTTMAVTVSPVISEVTPNVAQEETDPSSLTPVHPTNISVSAPATALVTPRIDVSETLPDSLIESPAPTTSVIVSPPATQTQVVTPTVKRPREESPGRDPDVQEGSLKRIRMVSEGSQTNQQHPTSVVTPTNIAVVPAAHVIRSQSPTINEPTPSTSAQAGDKEETVQDIGSPQNITSVTEEEELLASDSGLIEILEDDKEEQIIEWETQEEQETKIDDEFEAEVMDEETISGEVDEDIEQMQGIDVRSPDDEDMAEEQLDDAEDMSDQPTPAAPDLDILDSASNMQMDADSNSLQSAPTEQCMAPPAFPPALETPSNAPTSVEAVVVPISAPMQRTPVTLVPPRIERQAPVSRQHLTPFTIPGQGSNFEEGDDSIVPSTPTLYVPRRADGFAEAVSSPHVPQVRFLFSSSESSPTQQGLSQLASQEGLGVDDTRMDLSQFDEGGRTVPSTPLQVSPPAEANVPDVINTSLETDSSIASNEIIVPTIKVDLAEEPLESSSLQSTQKSSEIFEPVFSDSPMSKTEQDLKEEEKSMASTSQEQPGTSEAKEDMPADESTERDENVSATDGEQTSKDVTSSPGSQRKPIVWRKNTPVPVMAEASVTSETLQSTPGQEMLAIPGRGRTRARRARFAGTTATRYSRGRGADNTWSGTARRGRGTRRRTMY